MKGSYLITVGNSRVCYKFVVRRNITVLRGDSATGKTTLIKMIADFEAYGSDSGVDLRCERPCVVLEEWNWETRLETISGSIVFIDEGSAFVTSKDFARAIQKTDNYYVIATRASLFNLPYSVDEVYGIRNVTRSKYGQAWRLYSSFYPFYGDGDASVLTKPDVVIVEDSNAGYQFFEALCEREGIRCISAGGRDRVARAVMECDDETILVIADGATFGPEMEGLLTLRQVRNVDFFLPESFEWLVLQSGLVKDTYLPKILADPVAFIESGRYFSWERFFTKLLTERTYGTYLAYARSRLNDTYLEESEMKRIVAQGPVLGKE